MHRNRNNLYPNNPTCYGKYVNIRLAELSDADFILSIYMDKRKSCFLKKIESVDKKNIEKIILSSKSNEWYFVIENKDSKPIGTYKISNVNKYSFTLGSWVMIDGSSVLQMIEGEYLVRKFGFDTTKLEHFNFMVYSENLKVIKYHKLMGAHIIKEEDNIVYFESSKETYLTNIKNRFPEIL